MCTMGGFRFQCFINGSTWLWISSRMVRFVRSYFSLHMPLIGGFRHRKHVPVPLSKGSENNAICNWQYCASWREPSFENLPKYNQREGHYIIYKRGNSIPAHPERICWMICSDKRNRKFVATWPTLVSTEFKRRSRSTSQTCTPSPSNTPSRVSLRVSVLQLPCILWLRNAEYCHPHCGAHER